MGKIRSVLFVCTGNSCRSIMAAGLMKDALKRLGKEDIKVSSAGVSAVDGFHPTPETIEVMKKAGMDVSGMRSRRLTDEIIRGADLILVMAAHHRDDIISRVPEAASKTHILREYGKTPHAGVCESPDIFDPIGRPEEFYEYTRGEIKKEVIRIAQML